MSGEPTPAAPTTIGGRSVTIEPFNGRKAVLATRFVSRISKNVPDLLERDAAFVARYSESNALRITKGMALTSWAGRLPELSDEQWASLGDVIVIPQMPSDEMRVGATLMEAFEDAEEEALKLIALIVTPNDELAEHARAGTIKELLLEKSGQLLDDGSIPELIELAAAAIDRVRSELNSGDGLGKLRGLLGLTVEPDNSTPTETPTVQPATQQEEEQSSTTEIPSDPDTSGPAPTSSTDSPTSTGGTTNESSTEHPGVSSSLSEVA